MGYGFYLAQVVTVSQEKDNRLGVRVLPHMEGIPSNKCPVWPSFFRDEMYTGKMGDFVWVICDDEFSLGYVFGLANYNTYPDISGFEKSSDKINLSIPSELRSKMSESMVSIEGVMLSLDNVKVTYWDDNCIHYIERSTGGKIITYKSGSIYIFRQNECIIKIGPTIFKLDANGFSVVSDTIGLQGNYIGLGNSESLGHVLVTNGVSSLGAYPSKTVHA